jgi:predicted DNA-binding protein
MPTTTPRQFRLTDEETARLDALAHRWGPVKPLSRTEVIRELIRRSEPETDTRTRRRNDR